MPTLTIHLASASPRRSALLQQLGIAHVVRPVDIDESLRPGEMPREYVCRLSAAKAAELFERLDRHHVTLGADTCVALGSAVFGKPADENDCVQMLQALSGRTHEVHTAVTLQGPGGVQTLVSTSEVEFRPLSREECLAYWRSGEPRDKAGGYAVQGRAALFIRRIAGSYSGIVGLPLFETAELLKRIGVDPATMLTGASA